MKLIEKSDLGHNAIVTRLHNVREHPNADRLKLATVLGTQVVVGLESKEGDLVVYFSSDLRLSHDYLKMNNLYSNPEMNNMITVKGYFPKKGKVKAQKFRQEMSNGYVASLESFFWVPGLENEDLSNFKEGMEFDRICGVRICEKYVIPIKYSHVQKRKKKTTVSPMFIRHWDTKQLMREIQDIPEDSVVYVEEKLHGTSGRTSRALVSVKRPWYKRLFGFPKYQDVWTILSGTRRVDGIDFHLPEIRKQVHNKLYPHLRKGETLYYEVYGYDSYGRPIQTSGGKQFTYDCHPGEYKVMLYRVTITTTDLFSVDLPREMVYKRAEELGLEKPYLYSKISGEEDIRKWAEMFSRVYEYSSVQLLERSHNKTRIEGGVFWYSRNDGNWNCLKVKSEEFLFLESKDRDKGVGDVEDSL